MSPVQHHDIQRLAARMEKVKFTKIFVDQHNIT